MIEGFRSGSGSIHLTDGSGSGSRNPKNMWIRWIRIRNTDLNSCQLSAFHLQRCKGVRFLLYPDPIWKSVPFLSCPHCEGLLILIQNTVICSVADPGSGIWCLFDPWIRIRNGLFPDPGSRFPVPGSQTNIFESLMTIFWLKSSIIL